MLHNSLIKLFERDFDTLIKEIESYVHEESIWKKTDGINNSAGNLSLHLAGNLRHFLGHILGGSEYQRDRIFEFEGRVPREELLREIKLAKQEVTESLSQLTDQVLQKDFPLQVFGEPIKTEMFILHLYGHFQYHLGQINYHRRILGL